MNFDPNYYDPNKQQFTPPPPGDYPFTVLSSDMSFSTNGNEMITLKLACDVSRDKPMNVMDRLVFTENAMWKIGQFSQCTGISGEMEPADLIGLSGMAHLVLDKPNDKGKQYMKVDYYVTPEPQGYTESPSQNQTPTQKAQAAGNLLADQAVANRQATTQQRARPLSEQTRNNMEADIDRMKAEQGKTPDDDLPF